MEELLESIRANMAKMIQDMESNVKDGNKAAGARARKTSLLLEKQFKQYRKESIAASK